MKSLQTSQYFTIRIVCFFHLNIIRYERTVIYFYLLYSYIGEFRKYFRFLSELFNCTRIVCARDIFLFSYETCWANVKYFHASNGKKPKFEISFGKSRKRRAALETFEVDCRARAVRRYWNLWCPGEFRSAEMSFYKDYARKIFGAVINVDPRKSRTFESAAVRFSAAVRTKERPFIFSVFFLFSVNQSDAHVVSGLCARIENKGARVKVLRETRFTYVTISFMYPACIGLFDVI